MWIAIPAGKGDIVEKEDWINLPICKKLHEEKGINFGFQVSGLFPEIRTFTKNYPVGVHLPAGIADRWDDDRDIRSKQIEQLASLSLEFVVIHGRRIGEMSPDFFDRGNNDLQRYLSGASAQNYLDGLNEMEAILNEFMEIDIPITMESVAFNNFDYQDEVWQPKMHLDLRVGNYTTDLLEMRDRTGCEIVNDVQHLSFSLNFTHWKHNYSFLRDEVSAEIPRDLSEKEKMVFDKYHIFLRKGEVPLVRAYTLEEEIRNIGAKIYHLSGCYEGSQVEIKNGKVASHAEIRKDSCFQSILKTVLAQDPEVLVMEVSGSTDNPCWDYRRPTLKLQEESLKNLCELLLDEL